MVEQEAPGITPSSKTTIKLEKCFKKIRSNDFRTLNLIRHFTATRRNA